MSTDLSSTMARHLISVFVISLVALSPGVVFSHGADEPQHGGMVKMVGDMTFELVINDESSNLYLLDDGDLLESEGMQAKLKITEGENKSEIELTPAGGNQFSGAGTALPDGTKVMALITFKDGYSKLGARFVIGVANSH